MIDKYYLQQLINIDMIKIKINLTILHTIQDKPEQTFYQTPTFFYFKSKNFLKSKLSKYDYKKCGKDHDL